MEASPLTMTPIEIESNTILRKRTIMDNGYARNTHNRQDNESFREGDRSNPPRSLSPERSSIDRIYANKQQELQNRFTMITSQHHISYTDYQRIAYTLGQLVGQEHTHLDNEMTAENNREQIDAHNNRTQIRVQYNNLAHDFRQNYLPYANEILLYNREATDHNKYCPQSMRADIIPTHLRFMNIAYRQETNVTEDMFLDVDWNVNHLDPLPPPRLLDNDNDNA